MCVDGVGVGVGVCVCLSVLCLSLGYPIILVRFFPRSAINDIEPSRV